MMQRYCQRGNTTQKIQYRNSIFARSQGFPYLSKLLTFTYPQQNSQVPMLLAMIRLGRRFAGVKARRLATGLVGDLPRE